MRGVRGLAASCLLSILAVLTFTLNTVHAAAVDDGIEWSLELSGPPDSIGFTRTQDLIFLSKKNVLGLTHFETGEFVWRENLSDEILKAVHDDKSLFLVTKAKDSTISISSRCLITGLVEWNTPVQSDLVYLHTREDMGYLVLVLKSGSFFRVDKNSGHGTLVNPTTSLSRNLITIGSELQENYILSLVHDQDLNTTTVLRFKLDDTNQLLEETIDISGIYKDLASQISSSFIYQDYLYYHGSSAWESFKLVKVSTRKPIEVNKTIPSGSLTSRFWSNGFVVLSGNRSYYHTENVFKGPFDLDEIVNHTMVLYAQYSNSENDFVGVIYGNELSRILDLKIVSNDGKIENYKILVEKIITEHGGLKKFYFSKNPQGIRLYIVVNDGSTHAFINQNHVWSKYEELAQSSVACIVDFPKQKMIKTDFKGMDMSSLNPINRYIYRIDRMIKSFVNYMETESFLAFKNKNQTTISNVNLHGFKKLIIFGTKTGNIVALEALGGRVAWRSYYEDHSIQKIIPVGLPSDPEPKLLIVSQDVKEPKVLGLFALTGERIHRELRLTEKRDVKKVIVHKETEKHAQGSTAILVVKNNGEVHAGLYPKSDASTIKAIMKKLHTFDISEDGKSITGYRMKPVKSHYELDKTWSFNFPDGETVTACGKVPRNDKVASIGYMNSKKNIFYKYLNPNILAVATIRTNGLDSKNPEFYSSVVLYMIDVISGAVHFRTEYRGAGNTSPKDKTVKILQNENWVMIYLWNHGVINPDIMSTKLEKEFLGRLDYRLQRRREKYSPYMRTDSNRVGYEIGIHEMYENKNPDMQMDGNTYSSYSSKSPAVFSQYYAFWTSVGPIGITETRLGVTTKEIILGVASGQLYGISKNILSAKRGSDKTALGYGDAFIPKYSPLIGPAPEQALANGRVILGAKNIISSPTHLESTPIVVAWGIDIMCTSRTPSNVFDRVGDKFNHTALLATLLVLVTVSYISSYLLDRFRLKNRWV